MADDAGTKQNIYEQLETIIKNSETRSNLGLDTPAEVLTALGAPSTSIAVLENGKITTHNISVLPGQNPDTLFQACSISKPCGGLAIAKLIEQGYFGLDDKVYDLLPDSVIQKMSADARTEKLMRSVTIKQVMSHTAGLSVHGFPGYPVELHSRESLPDAHKILSGAQGVNSVQVKITAPPGLEFMYSGGGMTVLQAIAEHKTNKPFSQIMKELVFDPLGMTRTFYTHLLDPSEFNLAEAYYTGVTKCDAAYHYQPEAMAAGLWTTPTDLLKAAHALQTSLESQTRVKQDSTALLSRDLTRQILTPIKFNMGLTWFCDAASFGHGGSNNPGYRCNVLGYADLPWNEKRLKDGETSNLEPVRPPQNCGVSVMTNSATGDPIIWKTIHAVTYLMGWPQPPQFFGVPEMGVPFSVDGDVERGSNTEWNEYLGQWADTDGKYHWVIEKVEDKPVTGVVYAGGNEPVLTSLRSAATPPYLYKGGKKSVDLVLDGMEIMLRLGWELEVKDGKKAQRTVEMWHHYSCTRTVLYRKSAQATR